MINGKYPEQLIAMVSTEDKARLKAESVERQVSLSEIVRECIAARDTLAQLMADGHVGAPTRHLLGGWTPPMTAEMVADAVDVLPEVGVALRDYAAGLSRDEEPDEADGHLASARDVDTPVERPDLRVARRPPRGIT